MGVPGSRAGGGFSNSAEHLAFHSWPSSGLLRLRRQRDVNFRRSHFVQKRNRRTSYKSAVTRSVYRIVRRRARPRNGIIGIAAAVRRSGFSILERSRRTADDHRTTTAALRRSRASTGDNAQEPQARLCGHRSVGAEKRATNGLEATAAGRKRRHLHNRLVAGLYKIDATSGERAGSLGRMEPKQEKADQQFAARRLCGNLVISPATGRARMSPPTRNRQGGCGRQRGLGEHDNCASPRPPLAHQGSHIMGGAATAAWATGVAGLDAATPFWKGWWRNFTISAPGEPGKRNLEGRQQCVAGTGRRGPCVGPGNYDPAPTRPSGRHRQSGADVRSDLPAGDNLYNQQRDFLGSRRPAKMNWYFHLTRPANLWDYDEVGTTLMTVKLPGKRRAS